MDPAGLALLLGLGSAITLAAANAFVKASGDILMTRATLSLSGAAIVAPAAFFVPLPTTQTWTIFALSLPAHWFYQFALIRAMHRGDLSLVFPVMRGSAPLLTAIAALVILGEELKPLAIAGLLVASMATIVFALPEAERIGDKSIKRAALFWAVITGIGVAMYNIIDAQGVRTAPSQFTFIVWLFLLDFIGLNTFAIFNRRGAYLSGLAARWRYGVSAGALSVLSFGMALYGFSVAPVAYISALRETAVVFGALMGWFFLKEGFGPRRTMAAFALAGGLVLLQIA